MLLATDGKLSSSRFPFPSNPLPSRPTVFHRRTESGQSSDSETSYDGRSSDTDTDDDDDDEHDDDTIVRWGWVWHKGEMKKVAELPQSRCEQPGYKCQPPVFSPPSATHQECDTAVVESPSLESLLDDHQTGGRSSYNDPRVRSRERGSQHYHQFKYWHSSTIKDSFPSPRPSPVYVNSTPYNQKARKEISYRTVHYFDDEDSGNESEEEDDFDVADFLVDFLDDDEDEFLDD